MISNSFSFAVQFDSELGSKLNSYFQTTEQCNLAVRDFMLKQAAQFGFLDLADIDFDFIPADAEAGGFQAFVLSKDVDCSGIDRLLWASINMPDEDNKAWFPRVYREVHYLPYAEVLDILLAKTEAKVSADEQRIRQWQRWENPDGERAAVQKLTYEQVYRYVSDEDRAALTRMGDKRPLPQLSVARILRYDFLPADAEESVILPKNFEQTETFARGIDLWKLDSSLPVVNNGTLSLVLGLRTPDGSADGKEQFSPNLSWQIDKEAGLYRFTTNLVSDNPDFQLITNN